MPELPEVETIRADLLKNVLNKFIEGVTVLDHRIIRGINVKEFVAKVQGQKIRDVTRRGKALIIQLGEQSFLLIQPMMTGQLIIQDAKDRKEQKHTKIVFNLSGGQYLIYNDQRLFGRISLTADLQSVKFLQNIGPEPLERDFTEHWLKENLQKRTLPIKTLLMNQKFVAGIGNIYASEILFNAKIKPTRPANSLKIKEIRILKKTTVDVLKQAISLRGTTMRNYRDGFGQKGNFVNRIRVYGRENKKCFLCHQMIQKIVLSGRSTFFCKKCQH